MRSDLVKSFAWTEQETSLTSETIESFQVSHPIDLGVLQCSQNLLATQFANSYGAPFVGEYAPSCTGFNQVVLTFEATVTGRQFDRVGGLWLGGSEIWRYTSQEPSGSPITRWQYSKDVSGYLELFKTKQPVVLSLDNVVNDVYTGVFNVTVKLDFYQKQDQEQPANVIVPLSSGSQSYGWFSLPQGNSPYYLNVSKIPANTIKAEVEVFVSGHGNDEFWYGNVPDALATPDAGLYGGGTVKEVQLFVGDTLAGIEPPPPTIYTGGMNPLLWRPVVAINAFDVPTITFDVTPYLSLLVKNPKIGFNISVAANSYWFVDGNLKIWTEGTPDYTSAFQGELLFSKIYNPLPKETTQGQLNTSVNVFTQSTRSHAAAGTIKTKQGIKVASFVRNVKFSNHLFLNDSGNTAIWNQKTDIDYVNVGFSAGKLTTKRVQSQYPFAATLKYTSDGDKYQYDTDLDQQYNVKSAFFDYQGMASFDLKNKKHETVLKTRQQSSGFFGTIQKGVAGLNQTYAFSSPAQCYQRNVRANAGAVTFDQENKC